MYTYEITQDKEPRNPRLDYNRGTMICFHRRYNLGDQHSFRHSDYNSWGEIEAGILKELGPGVILPLYLYDHGGQRISTTPFSCRWDSGQLGFIYISKADILKELGGKILTKKKRERAEFWLTCEVEIYDMYLQGDVWGYQILDESGFEIESCSNFVSKGYCEQEAQRIVEFYNNLQELV